MAVVLKLPLEFPVIVIDWPATKLQAARQLPLATLPSPTILVSAATGPEMFANPQFWTHATAFALSIAKVVGEGVASTSAVVLFASTCRLSGLAFWIETNVLPARNPWGEAV